MAKAHSQGRVSPQLERALQRLLDEAPLYVWLTDTSGRTIWASRPWLEFAGRDEAAELVTSWADNVGPGDAARILEVLRAAVANRTVFEAEYRLRRADGEWRQVHTRGVPYEDASGAFAGHVGVNLDLTDLRANEARVLAIMEQQRAILDHLQVAIFTLDAAGRYRFVNSAWQQHFNPRGEEVVGRATSEIFPSVMHEAINRENAGVLADPSHPFECERLLPSASGMRPYLVQKLVIRDADGVTPLVCGVATDLSRVRQAEEARIDLEARLQQAQKLESLGRMAGGVAHDLNNLLTSVLGNVELALEGLPPDSVSARTLHAVQLSAQRAATMAQQMLEYTGHAPARAESVDPGKLVAGMRGLLAGAVHPGVQLSIDTGPAVPRIKGDPAQLAQVVMNLVVNASESLEERPGTVAIRVSRARIDAGEPREFVEGAQCPEGDCACLEVSDDGAGMDAETRRRVFEPFFSTRFAGRGLGLSTALGIVRGHGGGIVVESEPGRGSRFRVFLPALAEAEPAGTGAGPGSAAAVVLVVDDERTVRELACSALERAGFTAIPAADGEQALARWRERGAAIGLVIADIAMPQMDGPNLVASLHALDPGLPIVLMSGHTGGHPRFAEAAGLAAGVIEKPFRIGELLDVVRGAIRPASGA